MTSPDSGSPTTSPGADIGKRIIAAVIDGVLAGAMAIIPIVGGLVATAYMLLRDGLAFDFMKHRSIGKQALKLEVVRQDGQPMDIATSVKRNLPLAVGFLGGVFAFIPVIGKILTILCIVAGMALGIAEIVLVATAPDGRRLGDKLAVTQVVDSK